MIYTALDKRKKEVLRLREQEHKTFREIGEIFNISVCRSRSLYRQAVDRLAYCQKGGEVFHLMPPRMIDACKKLNLKTRSDIEKAIESKELHPKNKKLRGYGYKTHTHLCKWIKELNSKIK